MYLVLAQNVGSLDCIEKNVRVVQMTRLWTEGWSCGIERGVEKLSLWCVSG